MTEDELRDLSERTQAIMQLTEGIGWDLFVDRAKAEIEKHQNAILGGRLDEDTYRRETGWLQGALTVIGLPQQVQKEFMDARARFEEERVEADTVEA